MGGSVMHITSVTAGLGIVLNGWSTAKGNT